MKVIKVYIYGLFNKDVCEYVGATLNPEIRRRGHKATNNLLHQNPLWKLRVIETRTRETAADAECIWIAFFKAKGQAQYNKNGGSRYIGRPAASEWIVRCSDGRVFPSIAEAARNIGAPATTLFRHHAGKWRGLRLTKERRANR